MKIILMGNAGSGKSTLAQKLISKEQAVRLSLDQIAWEEGTRRKVLEESLSELHSFFKQHHSWILEGCYGDLIEAVIDQAEELIFLNPGAEVCVQHCFRRPWEPDKFNSPEEQEEMLSSLIQWVRNYEIREDEYSLKRHRKIFDQFKGKKTEYNTATEYA